MPGAELKICGLEAVRARFRRDAASIQRLYFDYRTSRQVGVITKALAGRRRVYRCVNPAELERISGTVHHGGIVAVAALPLPAPIAAADLKAWAKGGEPVLVLDRIGNAHNLGALARTAAFFGARRLVLTEDPAAARPNDAAYRVAEGGFEHLAVHATADLPAFLRALASAGYDVVGAATKGGAALTPPPKGAGGRVAVVLGNEEHGLAPETARACARLVTVPGSGRMESLNVSAVGAVLLWACLG
ncbi:MAG: TrmH family RNA methyltransferase [Opitutaceae bacterium]